MLLWSVVVNKITAQITTVLFLMLSVFLTGMDGSGTRDAGQDGLAARRQELQVRIETLRSEQDLLLFQKQMSVMDSKYLVLDLAGGHGQMKYRSRVFLDFTFAPFSRDTIRTIPAGSQVLTRKIEEGGRFALVFGPALVLRAKNSPAKVPGAPPVIVQQKEMRSIFFALEAGSIAYILR